MKEKKKKRLCLGLEREEKNSKVVEAGYVISLLERQLEVVASMT